MNLFRCCFGRPCCPELNTAQVLNAIPGDIAKKSAMHFAEKGQSKEVVTSMPASPLATSSLSNFSKSAFSQDLHSATALEIADSSEIVDVATFSLVNESTGSLISVKWKVCRPNACFICKRAFCVENGVKEAEKKAESTEKTADKETKKEKQDDAKNETKKEKQDDNDATNTAKESENKENAEKIEISQDVREFPIESVCKNHKNWSTVRGRIIDPALREFGSKGLVVNVDEYVKEMPEYRRFCVECVQDSLLARLNSERPFVVKRYQKSIKPLQLRMECPFCIAILKTGSKKHFLSSDFVLKALQGQSYEIANRMIERAKETLILQTRFCPVTGCSHHENNVSKSYTQCTIHGKRCVLCWKAIKSSRAHDEKCEGIPSEFDIAAASVKRCPGCRTLFEKKKGCNNMVCMCGREFNFRDAIAPKLARERKVVFDSSDDDSSEEYEYESEYTSSQYVD